MKSLARFAALACLAALPALAQETFPDTEYISGHATLGDKKAKGTLILSDTEIRFMSDKGVPLITVPLVTVTDAKATREHEGGSFGRKMMLGAFASKDNEYLEIDTRSDTGASALIFKTKKKQSAGMAEKIKFSVDKTKGDKAKAK